jgi:hypothetical protein
MTRWFPAVAFALGLLVGCEVDRAPTGLRLTPPGAGPLVRFDPTHRPLPDMPLPNDLAAFADPTSRTGVRVSLSRVGSSAMDRRAREELSSMEGWGVSAPITVSFERPAGVDPRAAAIDLEAVVDQMVGDENDPSNDPFYVVNLSTGVPVLVDVATGMYPTVLRDRWRYFPNDPKASESNLLFETTEEGASLPESAYRPQLDRDFDGVLDHPNVISQRGRTDLLTWYERETDTLILRPLVPLDERTEYAVVLTDRLRGPNGEPVRSPFAAIHHPAQTAGVTRLADVLQNKALANYYGNLAGTGLEHVAFAWTFTTQPTHEDMQTLRSGLYGQGPFGRWRDEYPPDVTPLPLAGTDSSSDVCKRRAATPLVLRLDDASTRSAIGAVLAQLFGLDAGATQGAIASLDGVDHLVVGSFRSPYVLGDPASRDPSAHFTVDLRTGTGEVHTDEVPWVLVVPKATATGRAPFPVTLWNHAETSHAAEALLYAGSFARQGLATIAYDAPGHGLVLSEAQRRTAEAALAPSCAVPLLTALTKGRAHDIDGDGVTDSGGLWWTADLMHTRDVVRQSVLDGMQLVRILRSWDGRRAGGTVAGDFDGDGVPDVGGPDVGYFATGRSLGALVSAIAGGVEPHLAAAAPIAGGGGLVADVAMRSYALAEAAIGPLVGPLVFAVPAGERTDADRADEIPTHCGPLQRSVRIYVNDGLGKKELEIACLDPNELSGAMTVVVTNITSGETRCARTGDDGRFRIGIASSTGDKLDVQIYDAPDAVASYDGCRVSGGAPVGRRIKSFEQATVEPAPGCDVPEGCQRFRGRFFGVGTQLVAPNDGLGLDRQSPALRRFRDLAQAAFDPGDPVAFAPYYMLKSLLDEHGDAVPPRALLVVSTIGDGVMPTAAGLSFARAAGAIPFLPPSAVERLPAYADYATPRELYDRLGRRTPMRYLVDNGVVEGVAQVGQTSAGARCKPNYLAGGETCNAAAAIEPPDCEHALFDPDWVSEGRLPFEQPHGGDPLRLARAAAIRATDSTSLAASWEPRLRGIPFGPDDSGWNASARVVGVFDQYVAPDGAHAWGGGDVCRTWDYAAYGNALIARFFASGGRDVYYLSHPKTHGCLVDGTCDFLR